MQDLNTHRSLPKPTDCDTWLHKARWVGVFVLIISICLTVVSISGGFKFSEEKKQTGIYLEIYSRESMRKCVFSSNLTL